MSEEVTVDTEKVVELVNEAQSKNKFDLVATIKGRSFPEDVVTVYTDVETAYALDKLNKKLQTVTDEAELTELEAKTKELSQTVLKSKLVFHMRGIDQRQVEVIERQARRIAKEDSLEDEWSIYYLCGLIGACIVKVEDADGNIDTPNLSIKEMQDLRGSLPIEVWNVLVGSMQQLTLATGYFKGLTDAGFLPKS